MGKNDVKVSDDTKRKLTYIAFKLNCNLKDAVEQLVEDFGKRKKVNWKKVLEVEELEDKEKKHEEDDKQFKAGKEDGKKKCK